jgi:hypothetical protein
MSESLDELRAKVHRVMARDGFCSVINDTKWRELCMAIYRMPSPPRFRIRDLLAPAGHVSDWDGGWYHHPYPYLTIEWMEIDPAGRADPGQVVQRLRQVGARFEERGQCFRVFGYTRIGTRPTVDPSEEDRA